jgi:tRNA (guanine-N7-)-methyltransferase
MNNIPQENKENSPLRSFGRRKGRNLRPLKQGLLDTLLPKLEISLVEAASLKPQNQIWLEIGFGGGEHLAHQAELHPHAQFIGCEPYINGIAGLLSHIEKNKLNNIRIYSDDARDLVAALPDASLERVFILYPDPWPKTRHNKRRIISTEFLDSLARVMKSGAELRLATDSADYATWMLERLLAHPAFEWMARTSDDWLNPPEEWIPTRYEQKALAGIPTYLNFKISTRLCSK